MPQTTEKGKKIYVGHVNIRQSIFFLMLKLVFLDVIFAVVAVTYFMLISNKYASEIISTSDIISKYNIMVFLIIVIIKIVLCVYVLMEWINEYYEIWPNVILHKSGFIIKNEDRHPVAHIRSLKVEQGLLGKFFGFGTITVYDWYIKKYTSLYLIHNPIKYFHIIENLIPKTEEEKQIFQEEEE